MHLLRAYAFLNLDESRWPRKYEYALREYDLAGAYVKSSQFPQDSIYYIQHRARTYLDSGNFEIAIKEFSKVISGNSGFPHQYIDMVNVYYSRGEAYEALEQYDKAKADYLMAETSAYDPLPTFCKFTTWQHLNFIVC